MSTLPTDIINAAEFRRYCVSRALAHYDDAIARGALHLDARLAAVNYLRRKAGCSGPFAFGMFDLALQERSSPT